MVNQSLYAKLPFDPETFVPVTVMAALPYVAARQSRIAVLERGGIASPTPEANPDKLNFGSAGIGKPAASRHGWLKTLAGIRMTHVPYRGSGPATRRSGPATSA